MRGSRWTILIVVLILILAACDSNDADETTTQAPADTTATTEAPPTTDPPAAEPDEPAPAEIRTMEAVAASITVDGDAADWEAIAGLEMVLEPIQGEGVENKNATVKVAHDGEFLYVLMTVEDDYNWNADDPHLSASPSVMWAVQPEAGAHMGTDQLDGSGPSLGMVDIWHWELECAIGENQGGAVATIDDAKPGNDPGCNFDDEFATDPEERYDDGDIDGPPGTAAENSLLGVFDHSNPTDNGDGTWTFEMRRPLQTGDSHDAQFAVGQTGLMALAYWDADNSAEGWTDAEHVQSSNQGWIEVTIAAGDSMGMRSIEATVASITVDGDSSDWDQLPGLDMVLDPIQGEGAESKNATVKAAHDGEFLYVLMTVDDDYDWVVDELHLTASPSVMWAVQPEAGPHMGTDDLAGEGPSMGMVDIWHWELQCVIGEQQGGAVSDVDEAKPGNDPGCNFDDEFATDPEERYDDGDAEGPAGEGAENSLLGVFSHTDPTNGNPGTWTFEMSRPLQTGDSYDAQFEIGGAALMALAYWDADNSPEGWSDAEHVQSSNEGWIQVLVSR